MLTWIRLPASLVALVALSGCELFPAIFNSPGQKACPEYQAGAGDFTPPFPNLCAGLNETDTGLRWIEITPGAETKGMPGSDATVLIHYEAFLAETGTRVDSSYARGEASVFELPQLAPGLREALQAMNPGDEHLVFLPSALALGFDGQDEPIPTGSDLVFRLKLDGFVDAAEMQDEDDQKSAVTPPVSD